MRFALCVLISLALAGCYRRIENGGTRTTSRGVTMPSPAEPIPPVPVDARIPEIDREVPRKFETATFALG